MWTTDFSRYVPVDLDLRRHERPAVLGGLALSALWSLQIPYRYHEALTSTRNWVRMGYDPAQTPLPLFSVLADGGFDLFLIFIPAILLLGLTHHQLHRHGSMSVYLMRRLPDRWEYLRRCWTVPLLGIAAAAALAALLAAMYSLIYIYCTPAAFLPPIYRK